MTPQPEGEAVTRAGAGDAGDAGDDAGARARASVIAFWDLRSPTYDDSPGHATHSTAEHTAWLAALEALLPPAPARVTASPSGWGVIAGLLPPPYGRQYHNCVRLRTRRLGAAPRRWPPRGRRGDADRRGARARPGDPAAVALSEPTSGGEVALR